MTCTDVTGINGIAKVIECVPDGMDNKTGTPAPLVIALHGYTHQDFASGYEFQAAPDPERRVRDGLLYLRTLLATNISVFVPPHNALSKRGLAAIEG